MSCQRRIVSVQDTVYDRGQAYPSSTVRIQQGMTLVVHDRRKRYHLDLTLVNAYGAATVRRVAHGVDDVYAPSAHDRVAHGYITSGPVHLVTAHLPNIGGTQQAVVPSA